MEFFDLGQKIRLRSPHRPLSATQHHPTTSLVGIALHCNEPWRFVSSILTAFCTATHCISIAYKHLLFQWLTRKWRKSNSYTNDIAYYNLEWTYRECWRDNELSHWNPCSFDCKVLLRRTEEEGSGRRHDRSLLASGVTIRHGQDRLGIGSMVLLSEKYE